MPSLLQIAGQGLVYAAVMAVVGILSSEPAYRHFADDKAMIKLTFAHGGQHKGGCREPTAEELKKLAPNMRRKLICPRERVPISVELEIDGKLLYADTVQPTGLRNDGPSRVYESFEVPAGRHLIVARLRDSERADGFDYEGRQEVDLSPGRNFVVQFRPEMGGFLFP